MSLLYPSIDTLFNRDLLTHKLVIGDYKQEIFSLIKEWERTEKIDGTNIRVTYDPGELLLAQRWGMEEVGSDFARKLAERSTHPNPNFKVGGRTENAQLPMGVIDYINSKLTVEKLQEIFGDKSAVIFGEGYGDKIQDGGGYIHPDDPVRQKFIIFDILIGGKYWLKRADVEDICEKLGLDVVPVIKLENTIVDYDKAPDIHFEDIIDLVEEGFKSQLGDGTKDAEGLVGRTKIPLFDAKHRRIICKLRTEDLVGKRKKHGEI